MAITQSDPQEWHWGMSRIAYTLKKTRSDLSPDFLSVVKNLNRIPWHKETKHVAHAFICCFAQGANPDGDPYQWKNYGDCGNGYALEFDSEALSSGFIQAQSKNNHTFCMSYGTQHLNAITREFYHHLHVFIKESRKHNVAFMEQISEQWSHSALNAALLFKHQKYRREQEYRLMSLYQARGQPLDVMSRPGSRKKIVTFNWRKQCPVALKRVLIGPAADFKQSVLPVSQPANCP